MSDNSNSFVRHEMLSERAPPVGERGVLSGHGKTYFRLFLIQL